MKKHLRELKQNMQEMPFFMRMIKGVASAVELLGYANDETPSK